MVLKILLDSIELTEGDRKYRQISHGIQCSLAEGRLGPGDKLPPQRELADALGVTLGTVTRAYKELDKLGLVRGETGRGTFIARREIEEFTLHSLHNRMDREEQNIVRFDLNFPVPEAMPDLGEALGELAKVPGLTELLRYQPTAGLLRHRLSACKYLLQNDIAIDPDDLVITTGAQHAVFTAFASRLAPGDCIAVDEYTYPGLLNIAGRLHLRLVPVAGDEGGMRPDELASVVSRQHVKGVYLIPTMHNPTTITMEQKRREEVAKTIRSIDLFLVEDDVYGRMEHQSYQPISTMIPERSYYITNLSKTLAPGLRIGYMTVPKGELSAVERVIASTTWMNPPLTCEVASRWIEDGTVERILQKKKELLDSRMRILSDRLFQWDLDFRPGGLHGWLKLPKSWKSETFVRMAASMGVQLVPSSSFATHGHFEVEAVRICVGPPETEAEVRRGADILASILSGRCVESTPIM